MQQVLAGHRGMRSTTTISRASSQCTPRNFARVTLQHLPLACGQMTTSCLPKNAKNQRVFRPV